jgi:hypothetical protein
MSTEITPEEQQALEKALQIAYAMQQADAHIAQVNAVSAAPTPMSDDFIARMAEIRKDLPKYPWDLNTAPAQDQE